MNFPTSKDQSEQPIIGEVRGIFAYHDGRIQAQAVINHQSVTAYFNAPEEAARWRSTLFQQEYEGGRVRLGGNSRRKRCVEFKSILCKDGFVIGLWYKQIKQVREVFEIFVTDVPFRQLKSIALNGPEEAYAALCYNYCVKCRLTLRHFDVMMLAASRYMDHVGVNHLLSRIQSCHYRYRDALARADYLQGKIDSQQPV